MNQLKNRHIIKRHKTLMLFQFNISGWPDYSLNPVALDDELFSEIAHLEKVLLKYSVRFSKRIILSASEDER
jgi:hypothetical protein